jgi:hypothetical protein
MSLSDQAKRQLRKTLDFYRGPNMADSDQAALRDFLTDVMHFAESEALDFGKAKRGAVDVYREEKHLR